VKTTTTTLFPENLDKFNAYFVDEETHSIKNAARFQNRIVGLLAYYGDLYETDATSDFPELIGPKVVRVPMSSEQFAEYDRARELERAEATYGKPKGVRFAKGLSSSSYRIRSRMISNFLVPEHALGPRIGHKSRKVHLNRITDKDLTSLHVYSPKMKALMDKVTTEGGSVLIYTEFVTRDQAIMQRVLDMHGYSPYGDGAEFAIKESKTYAAITGEVPVNERDEIADAYNKGKVKVLFISRAGAEGLDLKGTRFIHIFEPYWNLARMKQVIARGVRYKSHSHLPKKERNVTVFVYLSDYPPIDDKKEETTDVELYQNAVNGDVLNQSFIRPMAEASVDCHAHGKIKCLMCNPNDRPLFHHLLEKEMVMSNPCQAMREEKVTAKEIVFEATGEKFYYTTSGEPPDVVLYMYNEQLKGYTEMSVGHPYYSHLRQVILEK
jgi:superfamily II DNA or RNA helicase